MSNPLLRILLGALLLLGFVQPASAQAPDLTAGDLPPNAGCWFNLGPTGVQAWVYRGIEGNASPDTSLSRQIQVNSIEAGSPAAGILQVGDVIIGANGTGGAPTLFTADARKSFADAIADAEARNPATLALLVWRAGTTSAMTLTLRTMGAYSATAPFNCPKSAKILDEGLDYAMANQDAGYGGFSALALLAADNPADPKNAARQARAQTYALAQMLSPAQIKYIKDGNVELGAKIAWERGLRLVTLTEYYLKTGDAQVLPSIDAIALSIAHGQGANGAVGHLFNTSIKKGTYNEPFGRGYTMNASTLPSALGLVLARKCGVTLPELDPAIERVTRTLAGNAGLGTFNYYVEGEPGLYNEDNGKSALGAIVFAMHNDRVKEAKFMSNLAIGGAHTREDGHITHYFGLLWGPLGCQVGGQAAAVAHFNEIRWLMDLNRYWDGGFEYERYNSTGTVKSPGMNSGAKFWMSTAALLTYAMPLHQLEITGKTFSTRPELTLNNSEISAAVLSNSYDATSRSTAELMQDLQFDITGLTVKAAKELAARPTEATAQVETLIARAADPLGTARIGACRALGEIRDDRAVPTLLGLLSDPNEDLRYLSAEALAKLPLALLKENLSTLLQIAAANAKPAYPLDFDDAQQLAQMKLGEVIFGIYGTGGALGGDLSGIDRAILYPAIRAFAGHPHGVVRNRVAAIYNKLTPADVTALSDALIDGVNFFGLASMTQTPGLEGIKVLERDNWAEGIPLSKDYIINSRFKNIATGLTELQDYGTAALTVSPDPQVIDFLNSMLSGEYESRTDDTYNTQLIAIRDALLAASNPPVLPSFKSIQSVTASLAVLTLPAKQTQLNVSFTDLSHGDTVFSWRKVHGPGNVTFSTNDSAGSAAPQVYFEGVPGLYLFEVKAWDARNLTEVTGTVQVELRDTGGSLPANSPPTASAQSVTIAQAIPTPITLTGNDPEGYPFAAFEVISEPGNGTLGGTPPFLTYTSGFNFTGADSLSFRVRDSNGQWSAPATVSITVATRVNPVGLVIYEPVNYPIGNLNGKSGSSEIGFTGTWAANTSGVYPVTVLSTSLAYGGLPTAGGSLSSVAYTSRAVSPALAASGLLNDGATLWFSVLVGSDTSGKLRWALANNSFDSTTSVIKDEGAQLGRGVGFYMSSGAAPWTATVYAATFMDASTTNDTGDPMFLSEAIADTGILAGQGQTRLLVGKFTWGAAQDSIQLYLPTPDMILGPPVASLNTVVDQSTFDTITSTQARHPLDEMKFGATLESVLLGTVAMPTDITPPSPNAMTFANPPSLATATSATMRAATAFDANFGVEYYFTCTVGGAPDSGWQSSPVYTATGLTPGVSYSYTVKARDLSPALNETAPSAAFSVGTPATTVVPALVNLPQAQAEALITGSGLVVGSVTTAPSATIEAGNVVSQTPSNGTSAAPGSAVDLVISSTVQMSTVPNLVGLTQAAASSSLAAANLTPGTVLTDYSETIAAGVVMTQNPASGASLPRYAPVQLVVSAGSASGLAPLTQVLLEDFENPDVNSSVVVNTTVGGALPSNGNWGATGGYNVAGRGIIDKDSGAFNALDPNHQAFAIRSSAAGIVSSFGKIGNITAGTKYTVSVDIVKDSGKAKGTTADFQIKSFDQTANTSVLRDATNEGTVLLSQGATAPMSGEFKTVTFEYIATNGDPYLGKDLGLRITGGADGTYAANMDNVRVWTSGARLADTASPWSLTMTPADDASAVAVNSNLTMTFSENVVAGTGYITLKNLTNSSQQLISVTDTKQVSFSGSTLTINPEQNLSELSNYAILIGCDAVRDLGGNPYGGILTATMWNFSTAASTDSSAPTLTSIVDDRSGTPVDTGAIVTFTVTFNEDMNAQTVTSTDFGNAGSAGLKFLGVTETSPGVFTVLAMPMSTGTLQLRINAGTVLTDASGNPLNTGSALVDNTILTVNLGIAPPVWSSDPVTETNATEDSVYSSTLANNVTDANGDTLIFTKVSGPTWLTVATNGALSGTPINSNVGLNSFTVSVTDGNTAPVVATVDITVINTNDAPTFTHNPIYRPAVTRYAAYSSSITQYAQDIDGDTLTFAKTAGPAWLNVAADGSLSGTPGVGDPETNSFTVSIHDGIAAPVTATLSIKVNSADPVLPHIYEPFADTNSSLTGNTPGVGLSGTWTAGASVFVVDSSLNYGATPTSGLTMTLPSTTASVSTGTTLTNAGLLTNGATLWFSFLLEVDEATGTNDGIAMSFGSAAQSGGSGLTMSSAGNGVGISWDRGQIKGSCWSAGTRTTTTTNAGTPKIPTLVVASVTWGADDASNEVLSIYLPSQSLALPASPAITQTIPALTQSAFNVISFARRGGDGQVDLIDEIRFGSSYDHVTGQATGGSDTTPPTLASTNIVDNRSGSAIGANNPVIYTVTFSEDMNAATVGTNDFSNAGTSALTINSVAETSPGVFSVQATPTTAGTLILRVPAGAILTDVAGNLLNTAAAIIDNTTITVTTQNYAPFWNSNPITEANATEDLAYSSTLSDNATDANGNTLTFAKVSGPTWLTVATNGALSGTPTNSNVGVNSFVVSVSDGIATAVQATLNIVVINTNDGPVFLSDPFSGGNATEDLPFSNTIADSATDADGDTLTYAKVSGPAWLSVAADGTLSGNPTNANVGSNVFTVSVSDGSALQDTATLTVTVVNTNDLPSWTSNPITGTNGTATSPYSGTLAGKATDPDAGATLTYAKVGGPLWLNVATNGTLSGTPSTTEVGENAFTVSVTDGLSMALQATLNINVTAAPANNPLIYETFAQTPGTLNGQTGGIGLAPNTWTALTGPVTVTAPGLSYSTLPSVGGSAYMGTNPGAAQSSNAAIDVGTSLSAANALNDGTILWFSFLFKPESIVNNKDETFFALGNAGMSNTGTFSAGKSAVGVSISRNSRVNAAYWNNTLVEDNKTSGASVNISTLIVGKIEWRASTEIISLYLPGTNLALPTTAFSTITTSGNLTQSGFNIISWGGKTNTNARTFIDDIRFGASYASVVYASAPTLASIGFVDNVSGGPAMAGNLITYTVSFSEDIDATTVTAADFGNAGTSAITIGTITETSPGVFTVPVTPTNAGSLQLRVIAGAVITDVGGAALNTTTAIADNTTITVNAGNLAPTWTSNPVNESNATEEAAYTSTLADNASDANSNPLTFAKVSGPAWLNVAANGALSGTPANSNVGANSFTVSVTDSLSTAVQATLNITVINTNDAPTWTANPLTGTGATEDSAYSATLVGSASDVDPGASLTFAKASGPAWLNVATNGTLSGTPTNSNVGLNSFTISVTDGIASAALTTLNITVANTNDAPTWTSNPITAANATEGSAYSTTLVGSASDVDAGASLTFAKVSGPAWLSVATNGALSGTPTNSNVGANSFTVSVSDGIAGAVQVTLNITVVAINNAPTWVSNPITGTNATEDSAYSATLAGNASDVDAGASLTFAKVSGPAWLSVATNGALSGTPTNSNVGANSFTVSVSDGIATAVQAILDITVTNTNDAPTWTSDPITGTNATEDSAYSASLVGSVSDVDADASLTFTKASGPAWLTVAPNGALSGTPTNSDVGVNSFTVSVSDGIATAVTATLNVTVDNTNDAPTWTGSPITGTSATEDSAYSATLAGRASDADAGASLIFAKVSGPAWLSVAANGTLSGTPTNSDVGSNSFTISVTDSIAIAVQATLNITVTNTNDAPTWASNPITGTNATEESIYSATLTGSASDVDTGASLTFAKVSGPAWLSVAANGALSGTPTNSDVGVNSFTVSVNDGIATAVEATLNITVTNTNDAPTWTGSPITGTSATEDSVYSATLAGNASDVDAGASLTFAKVSGPAWLSVATNGTLSGTPTNSDVGTNSFSVSVSDSIATAVQATLNITVINTNDAPTWTFNPITGANATKDAAYSGSLVASAADVDTGSALTFAKVSGPAWLVVAANGGLSGTPSSGDAGANSFTVSVSDGIAPAVQATLNITVNFTTLVWDTDLAGNWTDITKWLGDTAYASGTDSTANFGNFITLDRIITLNAPITIGNITASDTTHNYTISGTGANILTLDRSSGIPTIDVTSGRTLTIGSQIAGLDGLQKSGPGTLTLTGSNSYTGDTTITLGTLQVGNGTTGSLNGTTGTALTFGGTGTFNVREAASSAQGMGALTFSAGDATITSTAAGASSAATLTFASLNARAAGATANFTLATNTTSTGGMPNKIVFTNTTNVPLAGGSNNAGIFFGGSNYARYDAAGYLRAVIYGTDSNANAALSGAQTTLGTIGTAIDASYNGSSYATANTTAVIQNGVNVLNVLDGSAFKAGQAVTGTSISANTFIVSISGNALTLNQATGNVAASTVLTPYNNVSAQTTDSVNTLNLSGAGASLTLAASQTLSVNGILRSAGTTGVVGAISGGTGIQTISSGGDMVVRTDLAGDVLNINSPILANGASSLTKSGAGILALSGNNTYTGVTTINTGTVLISHANALGTTAGNTTITATGSTSTGGQLQLTGGITCPENITITGSTELSVNAAAILGSANTTNTLSGNITLSNLTGGVRIASGNAGAKLNFTGTISQTGSSQALVIAINNTGGQNININNPIALNGGALILNGSGSVVILKGVNATDGSGIGTTTINSTGAGLQLGISNAINTTATLSVDGGTFNLANFNQTVNALTSTSTAGTVQNGVAGTKTLTVGNGGGSGTFSGTIITGTGQVTLVKTGIGTQTLNGTNTSTGGTRIDGGTLTLGHATNTLADTGAVNVNGGTLDLGTNTDTVGAVTLTSGSITGTAGVLTGSSYAVESGSVSAILAGAGVGLTKTTAGTVTLSGDNTYTGAINVNDGTLLVNGNQSTASGDVTVAVNATLGGTGTLGGNTTIAASGKLEFNLSTAAGIHNSLELATGMALTFSGASTLTITSSGPAIPGTYTLITGGTNITGVAPATVILPPGWTADAPTISGNSLLLNVTSTGATYTVTYNDNNATSGTAPSDQTKNQDVNLTLATNTGSLARTGYTFAGWNTQTDGSGTSYAEGASYTTNAALTLYAKWTMLPYTAWALGPFVNTFTDTTSTSNPDGDNLTNLQEFAFGTDPTTPVGGTLVYVAEGNVISAGSPIIENFAAVGQPAEFRAVFARRKNSTGLIYTVYFSADLSLWTASATAPTTLTGAGSSGDMEAVSVPFFATVPLQAGGSAAPQFFRVAVSAN